MWNILDMGHYFHNASLMVLLLILASYNIQCEAHPTIDYMPSPLSACYQMLGHIFHMFCLTNN